MQKLEVSKHDDNGDIVVRVSNSQIIVANCQVDSGLSEAKCKKWATLFASTPKMIEALEDAREVLLHYMDAPEWDNKHDSAYKKVCAAIERANRINK